MSLYSSSCLYLCIFTELRSDWIYYFKLYFIYILRATIHVIKYFFLILLPIVRFSFIRLDHILPTQSSRAGHLGCLQFFFSIKNMLTIKPSYYSYRKTKYEFFFPI